MQNKIILASKSKVRKNILDKNNIESVVEPSNVDEDTVKLALIRDNATPEIISKNLAELKSIKVSKKNPDRLVLGADSVISLNNELINKPKSRDEALLTLKKLLLTLKFQPPIFSGLPALYLTLLPSNHLPCSAY